MGKFQFQIPEEIEDKIIHFVKKNPHLYFTDKYRTVFNHYENALWEQFKDEYNQLSTHEGYTVEDLKRTGRRKYDYFLSEKYLHTSNRRIKSETLSNGEAHSSSGPDNYLQEEEVTDSIVKDEPLSSEDDVFEDEMLSNDDSHDISDEHQPAAKKPRLENNSPEDYYANEEELASVYSIAEHENNATDNVPDELAQYLSTKTLEELKVKREHLNELLVNENHLPQPQEHQTNNVDQNLEEISLTAQQKSSSDVQLNIKQERLNSLYSEETVLLNSEDFISLTKGIQRDDNIIETRSGLSIKREQLANQEENNVISNNTTNFESQLIHPVSEIEIDPTIVEARNILGLLKQEQVSNQENIISTGNTENQLKHSIAQNNSSSNEGNCTNVIINEEYTTIHDILPQENPSTTLNQFQSETQGATHLVNGCVPTTSSVKKELSPTDAFFIKLANYMKSLSPELVVETRITICNIVGEAELRALLQKGRNN